MSQERIPELQVFNSADKHILTIALDQPLELYQQVIQVVRQAFDDAFDEEEGTVDTQMIADRIGTPSAAAIADMENQDEIDRATQVASAQLIVFADHVVNHRDRITPERQKEAYDMLLSMFLAEQMDVFVDNLRQGLNGQIRIPALPGEQVLTSWTGTTSLRAPSEG